MTLLISTLAAVAVTFIWYKSKSQNSMLLHIPCFTFWGASIMWLTDAVFDYAQSPSQYFTPTAADMLNDTYLGLCAVTLGLIIWLVVLLIKDPAGKVRNSLLKQK